MHPAEIILIRKIGKEIGIEKETEVLLSSQTKDEATKS